ncbi:MAG: 50S ribosomal protein L23 [Gammaproteobacteria bacterium]
MNAKRLYEVLINQHITEKAVRVSDKFKQFVFKVALDSNKQEIKEAVQKLFSVKVLDVRTCRIKGKSKSFKQVPGQRSAHKKAYVSIALDQEINFESFQ